MNVLRNFYSCHVRKSQNCLLRSRFDDLRFCHTKKLPSSIDTVQGLIPMMRGLICPLEIVRSPQPPNLETTVSFRMGFTWFEN